MKYNEILEKKITPLEAYVAMTKFIKFYHEFTSSNELLDLIGPQIEFDEEGGTPVDNGFMYYWLDSVKQTLESKKVEIDKDWFSGEDSYEDYHGSK